MRHKWLEGGLVSSNEPINVKNKAETLGYDNLLFPFVALGFGVLVGLILVIFEKMLKIVKF